MNLKKGRLFHKLLQLHTEHLQRNFFNLKKNAWNVRIVNSYRILKVMLQQSTFALELLRLSPWMLIFLFYPSMIGIIS